MRWVAADDGDVARMADEIQQLLEACVSFADSLSTMDEGCERPFSLAFNSRRRCFNAHIVSLKSSRV